MKVLVIRTDEDGRRSQEILDFDGRYEEYDRLLAAVCAHLNTFGCAQLTLIPLGET